MAVQSLHTALVIYAGLNILALAVFLWDKLRAKVRMGRISENSLLLLASLAPAGSLAGMVGSRHKIRKVKFFLVPVFFILHILLMVWLWLQISG